MTICDCFIRIYKLCVSIENQQESTDNEINKGIRKKVYKPLRQFD